MALSFHTLDVFTDRVFGGNPLAVFPEAEGLSGEVMQRIAREMNLSETVFLLPPESGGTRRVRIFTPALEVPFAGHPTVGTGWFLVASGAVPAGGGDTVDVVLEETVGPVAVEVTLDGGEPRTARLTAAVPPTESAVDHPVAELAALVGVGEADVGARLEGMSGPLEPAFASAGLPFLILPLRDAGALARASLDPAAWARLLPPDAPSRMVYVVAPLGEGKAELGKAQASLRVRMFAPDAGVPEDPATGSAAAALGGYLGARVGRDGRHRWRVEQGIEMGRPSLLEVDAEVAGGKARTVKVGGGVVRVSRGVMEVPA